MMLHEEIEAYILDQITGKALLPGDQIPTEAALAEQFHASRPTVRQALERLKNQGYLVRRKGRGSFVTLPKVRHESTSFVAGYRQECEKKHQTLITRVLAQALVPADADTAGALGLREKAKVVCLTRLRLLGGAAGLQTPRPVVYTTVYVPQKGFEFLLTTDFAESSFYDTMAGHGAKVTRASRRLEVRMPPEEVARALKLGPFEPAIYITSIGRTAGGAAVEYAVSYYPASSSEFLIEVNQ